VSNVFVVRGTYDPDPLVRYRSDYGQPGVEICADYRVEVDAGIREAVRVINEVFEYKTFASCEGHLDDEEQSSYVSIGCVPKAELDSLGAFLEHEGFEDVHDETIQELMNGPPIPNAVYELTRDADGNIKMSDKPVRIEMLSGADLLDTGMISLLNTDGSMYRHSLSRAENPVEKEYTDRFASGDIQFVTLTGDDYNVGDLYIRFWPDEFVSTDQSILDECRDGAWEYILDILRRFKIHYHQLGNN
jgi:hypothetical protein